MLLLFLLLAPPYLQGSEPLDLKDCLQLALNRNRMIKISDLSVRQATEKIFESQSQQFPSLALNATYTRLGKVTSFDIPMGNTSRTFRFGVPDRIVLDARLQMTLFNWGRVRNGIQLSRVGRKISLVERKKEIASTTFQLLQAFYSVLLNERVIALHQENYRRAEEFYRISQTRFAAGGLPRLELLRSEVQAKNTASVIEESRGNLEKSKLLLAKLIGADSTDFDIRGSLPFIPVIPDVEEITARATDIRSDYIAVQLQQERTREQIQLANTGNKPNLSFFSGYNIQNGFDPTDPERFVDVWNVGLQLSIPLFDGFATAHKVHQAQIESQKVALQKEELSELITLQVRQAVTTLQQAAAKIRAQEENIQLSREALQVATDQYRQGVTSSLDVLNAQHTLAQNEMAYLQALFNHLMARLEISRTMEDFSWFAPELSSTEGAP